VWLCGAQVDKGSGHHSVRSTTGFAADDDSHQWVMTLTQFATDAVDTWDMYMHAHLNNYLTLDHSYKSNLGGLCWLTKTQPILID
jgi:hypothetical protein